MKLLDIVSSLIKHVLVRFKSKFLYITWGPPSATTGMFSSNPLPSCPWHITPAFASLSICFPFLSFYSSYTPLDPFPHPLSLFLFHLLSWAKPRNSLHTNSNYDDDDDDANAAVADDYYYYSTRHFFIFLIIPKNVFHVSHSLSNNGVYPRLDIGQVTRRHAELEAQCKHFFFSFFFTNSHYSPPFLNYFLSLSPTNVGVFLGNFPAPNN